MIYPDHDSDPGNAMELGGTTIGHSSYVADPANPTDEELSAAIQRGLDAGTLIDAEQWLAEQETLTGIDEVLAEQDKEAGQ